MDSNPPPDLGTIFVFGVLAFIVLTIGWKRDFFLFDSTKTLWTVPLRWFHVIIVFAIYFISSLYLTNFFGKFFHYFSSKSTSQLAYISWINFFNSSCISILLILFLSYLPRSIRKGIWKQDDPVYKKDIAYAAIAYFISFPLVVFVNHFLDFLLYILFQVQEVPDQLAVYYLKMTFGHPFYFALALSTIVFFAPFIEELIFRGFLQSFIRQHLGSKQAIAVTSILFALFHYSPEQGLANITIVGSLCTLSLFIGFIYEKRGSLVAPMMLHGLFNAMSVMHLYFLGGIPKGAL